MVKNEILAQYNSDPEKIKVVHNGVEWFELQEAFDNRVLNNDAYHFLFVGHGFERKGLSFLIRALEGLPARLSVIGKDKRIQTYKRLAKIKGVDATFYGAISAIPYYQTADCLVIPSLYDPFANVTVEALAMGLLVISSKTNGGHEILSPENGIVYDDLREALKEAMERKRDPLTIRNSVQHLDFSNQIPKLING